MDHQEMARQTTLEHGLLNHLLEGLRIVAGWEVVGENASRKLSTLTFLVQSFQRHLERLLALEEDGGYMDLVEASAPQLARAADALKAEHDLFRSETRRIVQTLERQAATDGVALEAVCRDLVGLVGRIDLHNKKEIDVLQEALEQETGGEG
jgi:hemerythrin-like domain-containing protein